MDGLGVQLFAHTVPGCIVAAKPNRIIWHIKQTIWPSKKNQELLKSKCRSSRQRDRLIRGGQGLDEQLRGLHDQGQYILTP
jgi:hypothetical protein